jgi:sorbose reductase
MSILDRFMLTGKKAVVTGGAQGIGEYGAIALAEVGADIAIIDIQDASGTIEKVKKLGRNCFALKVDVSKEKEVNDAFAEIEKKFGTIDVVFNNAGICICQKAEDMTFDEWHQVIDINLSAVFLVARAAGKIMIKNKKGGSIINTASMSGHIVNIPQEQCAYNASKAGVIHLTKSLAVEWAKHGIRVNAISPGYVGSPMSLRAPEDWKQSWYSMGIVKRMCEPAELQGALVYFAGNASTYTTGSDLVIDGGFICT